MANRSLPHRPGPQPAKTDRANCPSVVVEYPVSEPISFDPTIVLDQVLGPGGKSWVPPQVKSGKSLDAVPNEYAVFRGDLRHGVIARKHHRRPFQENEEVSRAAPNTVDQLLG